MKILKKLGKLLILTVIILTYFSCSNNTRACEESNQGTIIFDNSANNGTLFVYINYTGVMVLGRETISVAPNKTESIEYPSGPLNIRAFIFYSNTNKGDEIEKNINLDTCETTTVVY